MTDDELRLVWIAKDSGIDGFGEFDVHEIAAAYAEQSGLEEPRETEYLFAVRDIIDGMRKHDAAHSAQEKK